MTRSEANAYEKLHARAASLLDAKPRPSTTTVADQILREIAAEFRIDWRLYEAFADRLRPALVTVVSAARARLIREMEEAAVRPYLARPVPSAELPAMGRPQPIHVTPASALGDGQRDFEGHAASAVPPPAPEFDADHGTSDAPAGIVPSAPGWAGGQTWSEAHSSVAALPAPQADGQPEREVHGGSAVPVERGDEAANKVTEPSSASPPVTPLSLRAEVLDGWRPLRDELLFVPEHPDVTYGSATAEQRQRAMTYYHSVGLGWVAKARRMRALDEAIRAAGAGTLNELLDGRGSRRAVRRAT